MKRKKHLRNKGETKERRNRMKVKLRKLYEAKIVLDRIFNEKMDAKLAYRLNKISKKVNTELNELEKQRIVLVKKYADEQTEEQKKKNIPARVILRLEEFIHEFDELLDSPEEIEVQKIPFVLIESIKLSANDLETLEDFIEENQV